MQEKAFLWIRVVVLLLPMMSGLPCSAASLLLDEMTLLRLARKQSATVVRAKLQGLASEVAASSLDQQYGLAWESSLAYEGAPQQDALFPKAKSQTGLQSSLVKKLGGGLTISGGGFYDQFSRHGVTTDPVAVFGLRGSVGLDLWKNKFGMLDRLERGEIAQQRRVAEVQEKIDLKHFEYQLRRVFWALIANQNSVNVTDRLITSAEVQLREAVKRRQAGIGTDADVARYRALKSSRESGRLLLVYEGKSLRMQLADLLPELRDKTVRVPVIKPDQAVSSVLECTRLITSFKDLPLQYTLYDELVNKRAEERQTRAAIDGQLTSPTLRLTGSVEHSADSSETAEVFGDIVSDGKTSYAVALSLAVPLGQESRLLQSARGRLADAQLAEVNDRLLGRVSAMHHQMGGMIELLYEAVRSRRLNSDHLEAAYSQSKKLFEQARVGVDVVINDENAIFSSHIDEIQVKLTVVQELLNYLEVFQLLPCQFNRL